MSVHRNGVCLGGRVLFVVNGGPPAPDACHGPQCRDLSGHFFVSADVKRAAIAGAGEEHLRW